MQLFPYQIIGKDFLKSSKTAGLWDDPGLGKSFQSLAALKELGIKNAIIVCPASVRMVWKKECEKVGLDSRAVTEPHHVGQGINVVSYEGASGKCHNALAKFKSELMIIDECFPSNTMIATENGLKEIGSLCVNNLVITDDNGTMSLSKITRVIKKPLRNRLVKVTHDFGSLICTENHKVWTEDGYKISKELDGACLRILSNNVCDTEEGQDDCEILQPQLHRKTSLQSCGTENNSIPKTELPKSGEVVRVMQSGIQSSEIQQEKILFKEMQCNLESKKQTSTHQDQGDEWVEIEHNQNRTEANGHNEGNDVCCPTKEIRVSIGETKELRENEGQNISSKGRKRENDRAAGDIIDVDDAANGISYIDLGSEGSISFATKLLQGGSGLSEKNVGGRGRWENTQAAEVEVFGQEENRCFKRSRVVSVEILERGSDGESTIDSGQDQFVYDLEIEGTHNYFAEGVKVSNCHYLKTHSAKRTQAFNYR